MGDEERRSRANCVHCALRVLHVGGVKRHARGGFHIGDALSSF